MEPKKQARDAHHDPKVGYGRDGLGSDGKRNPPNLPACPWQQRDKSKESAPSDHDGGPIRAREFDAPDEIECDCKRGQQHEADTGCACLKHSIRLIPIARRDKRDTGECRKQSKCLTAGSRLLQAQRGENHDEDWMVAEITVPTDADVAPMPSVWVTWPTPIPKIPSAATRGNARHGRLCSPITKKNSNGTAAANRKAVSVKGGTVTRPSFVTGIESPHMTASNSMPPKLRMEGRGARRAMPWSEVSERVPAILKRLDMKAHCAVGDVEVVARVLAELTRGAERLRAQNSGARLTISTSVSFGIKWLAPRLHRLMERYPEFDIHLDVTDITVDLSNGRVDAAVRYGSGQYPQAIAERILES